MKKRITHLPQLDTSKPTHERHATIIIPPKTTNKINVKEVFELPNNSSLKKKKNFKKKKK